MESPDKRSHHKSKVKGEGAPSVPHTNMIEIDDYAHMVLSVAILCCGLDVA